MPVSVTDRGVPSTPTLKVPGILPLTVGVKLTRMLQLVNAGSEAGQLLVCVKSVVSLRKIAGDNVTAPLPVLFRVIVQGLLVVLMVWLPKLMLPVEKKTACEIATPVPVRGSDSTPLL